MKRVVSVSLGSKRRDHKAEAEILGQRIRIERRGTDGDLSEAIAMVRELDGEVDAIGLGGVDLYLVAGDRRYMLADARQMAEAACKTPVVDGSGLKNTLERRVIEILAEDRTVDFSGSTVLVVSALDRFGMAEALQQHGAALILGDIMFGLGLPIPLRSLRTLGGVLRVLSPVISRLPMHMLYPTGGKQEEITPRFRRYYEMADIVAGDLHYIRRYMPDDLDGKVIITNTVTEENVEEFRSRKAAKLITTTPALQGRSFGTNVLEAVLVALSGRPLSELNAGDYDDLLQAMEIRPRVEILQSAE